MEIKEALDFINADDKRGSYGKLDTIASLLEKLGNPHKNKKYIHVTGTNGKGSTSNFLSNILIEAGYKVGLYTSPHIFRINERIKVNNCPISDGDLVCCIEKIKNVVENDLEFIPTYFEILTACAFLYFNKKNLDYIILEVGIGGEVDPTNVIENTILSIITPIGLDHTDKLGKSKVEIASVKSKIIKNNTILVSAEQELEVRNVLIKRANDCKSPYFFLDNKSVLIRKSNEDGNEFIYDNNLYNSKMIGEYQVFNASLAILAAKKLNLDLSYSQVFKGIKNAIWPARMTVLDKKPLTIVDGAHNDHGIGVINKSIRNFNFRRLILVFGKMADKNIGPSINNLSKLAYKVIFTEIDYKRAESSENLIKELGHGQEKFSFKSNIESAIEEAKSYANDDDFILYAGSLYLAEYIIRCYNKEEEFNGL